MTTWILLYIVLAAEGVATNVLPSFSTLMECEMARNTIATMEHRYGYLSSTCIQRTLPEPKQKKAK